MKAVCLDAHVCIQDCDHTVLRKCNLQRKNEDVFVTQTCCHTAINHVEVAFIYQPKNHLKERPLRFPQI